MSYTVIQPPFPLRFKELSKTELKTYAVWFHNAIPGRIAELTRTVNGTPGYEQWTPNGAPESLDTLGRWFELHVGKRTKTAKEIETTLSTLTFPIDIPREQLTDETFSLAMDIGMYFGDVVLKNVPGTRWDQHSKGKNFVDYGQPVITGFGRVWLNPVRVLVMTAYRIAEGHPADLHELYETWAKKKQ